jgi:hypothetical protein
LYFNKCAAWTSGNSPTLASAGNTSSAHSEPGASGRTRGSIDVGAASRRNFQIGAPGPNIAAFEVLAGWTPPRRRLISEPATRSTGRLPVGLGTTSGWSIASNTGPRARSPAIKSRARSKVQGAGAAATVKPSPSARIAVSAPVRPAVHALSKPTTCSSPTGRQPAAAANSEQRSGRGTVPAVEGAATLAVADTTGRTGVTHGVEPGGSSRQRTGPSGKLPDPRQAAWAFGGRPNTEVT